MFSPLTVDASADEPSTAGQLYGCLLRSFSVTFGAFLKSVISTQTENGFVRYFPL
jgi:hypothetical protein